MRNEVNNATANTNKVRDFLLQLLLFTINYPLQAFVYWAAFFIIIRSDTSNARYQARPSGEQGLMPVANSQQVSCSIDPYVHLSDLSLFHQFIADNQAQYHLKIDVRNMQSLSQHHLAAIAKHYHQLHPRMKTISLNDVLIYDNSRGKAVASAKQLHIKSEVEKLYFDSQITLAAKDASLMDYQLVNQKDKIIKDFFTAYPSAYSDYHQADIQLQPAREYIANRIQISEPPAGELIKMLERNLRGISKEIIGDELDFGVSVAQFKLGNGKAAYHLAKMFYDNGKGDVTLVLLEDARLRGYIKAYYLLAHISLLQNDLEQQKLALQYFKIAANQGGYADAHHMLSQLYLDEDGRYPLERNFTLATAHIDCILEVHDIPRVHFMKSAAYIAEALYRNKRKMGLSIERMQTLISVAKKEYRLVGENYDKNGLNTLLKQIKVAEEDLKKRQEVSRGHETRLQRLIKQSQFMLEEDWVRKHCPNQEVREFWFNQYSFSTFAIGIMTAGFYFKINRENRAARRQWAQLQEKLSKKIKRRLPFLHWEFCQTDDGIRFSAELLMINGAVQLKFGQTESDKQSFHINQVKMTAVLNKLFNCELFEIDPEKGKTMTSAQPIVDIHKFTFPSRKKIQRSLIFNSEEINQCNKDLAEDLKSLGLVIDSLVWEQTTVFDERMVFKIKLPEQGGGLSYHFNGVEYYIAIKKIKDLLVGRFPKVIEFAHNMDDKWLQFYVQDKVRVHDLALVRNPLHVSDINRKSSPVEIKAEETHCKKRKIKTRGRSRKNRKGLNPFCQLNSRKRKSKRRLQISNASQRHSSDEFEKKPLCGFVNAEDDRHKNFPGIKLKSRKPVGDKEKACINQSIQDTKDSKNFDFSKCQQLREELQHKHNDFLKTYKSVVGGPATDAAHYHLLYVLIRFIRILSYGEHFERNHTYYSTDSKAVYKIKLCTIHNPWLLLQTRVMYKDLALTDKKQKLFIWDDQRHVYQCSVYNNTQQRFDLDKNPLSTLPVNATYLVLYFSQAMSKFFPKDFFIAQKHSITLDFNIGIFAALRQLDYDLPKLLHQQHCIMVARYPTQSYWQKMIALLNVLPSIDAGQTAARHNALAMCFDMIGECWQQLLKLNEQYTQENVWRRPAQSFINFLFDCKKQIRNPISHAQPGRPKKIEKTKQTLDESRREEYESTPWYPMQEVSELTIKELGESALKLINSDVMVKQLLQANDCEQIINNQFIAQPQHLSAVHSGIFAEDHNDTFIPTEQSGDMESTHNPNFSA